MPRVPFPEAARGLLRDTLMDAAAELMRDRRWSAVTMGEIAHAAGVSRQTLYNEFGDRRGLAQAFVLREADRFLTAAEEAISEHPDDPRGALTAAFEEFLTSIAEHPVVEAIRRGDGGDELVVLVTAQGLPVLSMATDRLGTFLATSWPRLSPEDARALAECFIRLAISHAALPTAPPPATAAQLAKILGPHLDQLYPPKR
jgi:AcrR family transcriptional regulator